MFHRIISRLKKEIQTILTVVNFLRTHSLTLHVQQQDKEDTLSASECFYNTLSRVIEIWWSVKEGARSDAVVSDQLGVRSGCEIYFRLISNM